MSVKKQNIIFCGTPEFSIAVLEALYQHDNVIIKKVVTMPDRASGRGQKPKPPPVAEFAKQNNISLLQTDNINNCSEFLSFISDEEIDFIIVFAFAQFLGTKLLSLPKLGCFNIHTSLLPKYRGAAPIQYALLNGDSKTGITIQKMEKKMDAGDIVILKEIEITSDDNYQKLANRLQSQAIIAIKELITMVIDNDLKFSKQDENLATFAPTLKKKDGLIDFEKMSTTEIQNRLRALTPWPGIFCFLENKRLKIFEITKENKKLEPGEIFTEYNSLLIGASDGTLRLSKVQIEGKTVCSDTQFLNGFKNSTRTKK